MSSTRKQRMRGWRHALLGLFTIGVLAACAPSRNGSGKGLIYVSIEPLRYFTEAVAGDRFTVKSVVTEGYSPETYEPSPRQLMDLENALLYIKVGNLGFETTWLPKMLANAKNVKVVNASEAMPAAADDPHQWTSPRRGALMAQQIGRALCEIDPPHADGYTQRLNKLLLQIDSLDHRVAQRLAACRHRTFIIAHPALTYFAEDYGMTQLSIEPTEKEPTPQELAQLIDEGRRAEVKVVLVQPEFNQSNAEVVAREVGARLCEVHPLSYEWQDELWRTACALGDKEEE